MLHRSRQTFVSHLWSCLFVLSPIPNTLTPHNHAAYREKSVHRPCCMLIVTDGRPLHIVSGRSEKPGVQATPTPTQKQRRHNQMQHANLQARVLSTLQSFIVHMGCQCNLHQHRNQPCESSSPRELMGLPTPTAASWQLRAILD